MTSPISNVDRLVLILRQRLEQRAGGERTRAGSASSPTVGGLSAAKALAALSAADERQIHRALVQGLLSDRFGSEMVNEARFQTVVDQVTRMLETDANARQLLDQVTAELHRLD